MFASRPALVGAVTAVALALPAYAGGVLITPDGNPNTLAGALSAQGGLVTGAAFTSGPSGPPATGIAGPVGIFFPTDGANFAVLTTGDVVNADPPNDTAGKGTSNGTTDRDVRDLTILKVDVNVPAGHNCIGFDFAFYSEEFPEFVGSAFNDAFLAELDANDWDYDPATNTVTAPSNFAFDTNAKQITVNSAFAASSDTGLQYDGSTVLLRARKVVAPGAHSLYFTIYDAGDNIFDSAVFLDNLRSANLAADKCISGAQRADTDADGLIDEWETGGVDVDGNGTIDLDLPAMGANPLHKDIFVELDFMPNHGLSQTAINTVVASFAAAPVANPDSAPGINLHVDNGPTSPMKPGATWGTMSASSSVAHTNVLGTFNADGTYNWTAVDTLKAANFSPNRVPVFHYVISGHQYGSAANTSSGISRGIGSSDFLVTLAAFCAPGGHCSGTVGQQAGTFMHELGHNIGLRHGGNDDTNRKPNYLSIMNYAFQMSGLTAGGVAGRYDYSRFGPAGAAGATDTLGPLSEPALVEATGFGVVGAVVATYTTVFRCPSAWVAAPVNVPIDWDCSGAATGVVSGNINNDSESGVGILGTLTPFDDWSNIRYKGGAIGGFGLSATLPASTTPIEPPASVLKETSSVAAGDTSVPTVKIGGKRKVAKGQRAKLTILVEDDKGIELLILVVDGKQKTIAGKGKKAVSTRVSFKKGTHRIVASALDRAGNASKAVRAKVSVSKKKTR